MANINLLKSVSTEQLEGLGFKRVEYLHENSDVTVDVDWIYENDKFKIQVDAWLDVTLHRKDILCESIGISVSDLYDLEILIDWIEPEMEK